MLARTQHQDCQNQHYSHGLIPIRYSAGDDQRMPTLRMLLHQHFQAEDRLERFRTQYLLRRIECNRAPAFEQ
ncbi:hypothetical protein D3C81_2218350 [compost metagenome]